MCIIPEVVTENSVNMLRMENYTKEDLGYGGHFAMEYFNGDNWTQIEFDFMFTDMMFTLPKGEATEGKMNLYSLAEEYNDSKKGRYRIIKNVNILVYPDPPSYNLIAAFEIK